MRTTRRAITIAVLSGLLLALAAEASASRLRCHASCARHAALCEDRCTNLRARGLGSALVGLAAAFHGVDNGGTQIGRRYMDAAGDCSSQCRGETQECVDSCKDASDVE